MDSKPFGTFDYVIVGAGTAGCVLANRLSQDPAVTVLLLEAGGKDDYLWIHIPVGYLYCMGNPRTDWGFRTESEPGLNGRSLVYPRGKVLGGCSSVNGMIYMRGQAADYDGWRQMGNVGWGWDDVLPYFLKSEDHHGGKTPLHGAGGEWKVARQRLGWDILKAVQEGAKEFGIMPRADFNDGDIFYGFPDLESRGVKFAHDAHGVEVDPDTQDRRPTAAALKEIVEFRDRRFPALRGAPLTEARVCQYENSSNGDFLIDFHPRLVNVLLVYWLLFLPK